MEVGEENAHITRPKEREHHNQCHQTGKTRGGPSIPKKQRKIRSSHGKTADTETYHPVMYIYIKEIYKEKNDFLRSR